MITLSDLIAAKTKQNAETVVNIPDIGETKAYRLPARRFAELAEDANGFAKHIVFTEHLVYESIPLFRAKELRDAYEVSGQPEEVVTAVLGIEGTEKVADQLMDAFYYRPNDEEETKN